MRVTPAKILIEGRYELAIFYNQAWLSVEELGHQSRHKIFDTICLSGKMCWDKGDAELVVTKR